MLFTGLLSITFRQLPSEEIVRLTAETGLAAIEWGGDVHVPPGDRQKAADARAMTEAAGLKVASYGSYYRVGVHDNFDAVLESGLILGAPTIRVWAGDRGTDQADEAWWETVIADTKRICELAGREGVTISFEFHRNTLTDHADATVRLLRETGADNLRTYWQPQIGMPPDENVQVIRQLSPWLSNVHVFHWREVERLPLSEGEAHWRRYLDALPAPREPRYAMLEFVKDDDPAQFRRDAEVLKRLVESTQPSNRTETSN